MVLGFLTFLGLLGVLLVPGVPDVHRSHGKFTGGPVLNRTFDPLGRFGGSIFYENCVFYVTFFCKLAFSLG